MFFRTRLRVTSKKWWSGWSRGTSPLHHRRNTRSWSYSRDGGEFVGGVAGYTHWNWLFVSHLWVGDGQRGDGLGTRLMRAAESAAVDRGARHAHVDTYDFQALAFYEHLGYTPFGVLNDYPPRHSRHFLQRDLP